MTLVKIKLTYGGLVYKALVISLTASKHQIEVLEVTGFGSAIGGKCRVSSCFRPDSTVHNICCSVIVTRLYTDFTQKTNESPLNWEK